MKNFSDLILEAVVHSEEVEYWKKQVFNTRTKINTAKRKGKPVTPEMEEAFAKAQAEYQAAKEREKNGSSTPTEPTKPATATVEVPDPTPQPKPVRKPKKTTTQPVQQQAAPPVDPNSKDYKAGYEAALKKIREAMNTSQGSGGGGGNFDPDPAPIPQDVQDKIPQGNQNGKQIGGKGTEQRDGNSEEDRKGSGTKPGDKHGVVKPEDCGGMNNGAESELGDTPGTAGGMISKETGDAIAEAEGYDKSPGSKDAQDKEWSKNAMDAAAKMKGKGKGYDQWASKIITLNRVTTNWKQVLKKVVGRALSEEDKRQAYANKNVLIAQNRIARTDKDKYDATSCIVAFVDTSGSMSNEYKAACLKETYQAGLQKKACKMVIVPFDDGPRDVIVYDNLKKMESDIKRGVCTLKGGGGTDVKGCFDLLKTDKRFKGQCFELVMVFTDGYLSQVKRDPRSIQNLCWVIADNPAWELEYKDKATMRIDMDSRDFK